MKKRLGVNIDHIATLREVRKANYPDPVEALLLLKECGVDQVTCHLREDRRHIQDHDLDRLLALNILPVNLEMALTDQMLQKACAAKPHTVTLVPEKRQEITTEGGLNLGPLLGRLKSDIRKMQDLGIRVSLFIDPNSEQVDLASKLKADAIELHTGTYCESFGTNQENSQWQRLYEATLQAEKFGLLVFAGHGLTIQNLPRLTKITEIQEYNIGHSIIARSVFVGLKEAILEVQKILAL